MNVFGMSVFSNISFFYSTSLFPVVFFTFFPLSLSILTYSSFPYVTLKVIIEVKRECHELVSDLYSSLFFLSLFFLFFYLLCILSASPRSLISVSCFKQLESPSSFNSLSISPRFQCLIYTFLSLLCLVLSFSLSFICRKLL